MDWQMLAWSRLADAAAGGLIVLIVGSLAARLCRQPVRRARIVVLTLLGALVVPGLGALPFTPHWSAGLLPAPGLVAPQAHEVAPADTGSGLRQPDALRSMDILETTNPAVESRAAAEPKLARVSSEPAQPSPEWRRAIPLARTALLACDFAMSAGLAAWWLIGQLVVWRVARAARPVPKTVRDVFNSLAGRGGGRVILLESDRIAQPFTYTWLRPVIVLPKAFCEEDETGALRYVLAHEWSHVERRDAWAWNLACVAGLVLFYQPLFWWLRRQLRLCQDYLADARAAAVGSAEDYAAFLVRLARAHRFGPIVPALGIGDRRSNLYRRVIMLVQDHEPLERHCQAAWSLAIASAAALVIVAASGLRLGAAAPAGRDLLSQGGQAVKDVAKPPGASDKVGETLHYKGTVVDKDTGRPIAGATVVVRRSILKSDEYRVLQETRHITGVDGTYAYDVPPDQYASPYLCIGLDVEHPDYATGRFGSALGKIRKNETLGERPFFETIEMRPAKPITGRIQTPLGQPATGLEVHAYSHTDKVPRGEFESGSFARAKTDAEGRFRLPIITPGGGMYWTLPKAYAPELHVLSEGKRGELGTITLEKGVTVGGRVFDAQGKPLAGISVEACRTRGNGPEFEAIAQFIADQFIADQISRTAKTDADGRFLFDPLPPGSYCVYRGGRSVGNLTPRELPGVFAPKKLTIKDGEIPEPLEIRAAPFVVIEGRRLVSKGQAKSGCNIIAAGEYDESTWHAETRYDASGKFGLKVLHGLKNARLFIVTDEYTSQRHRIDGDEPLTDGQELELGTLDRDVKGIEIVLFVAPIIIINATTKDGQQIKGFKATVEYTDIGAGAVRRVRLAGGKREAKGGQNDGRYRTTQMLPGEEVEVTVSADGYTEASRALTLPEGKTEELTFVLEPTRARGAGK